MGQYVSQGKTNASGWGDMVVPLAAIETELEKLWKSVAQEGRRAARSAAENGNDASAASPVAGISRARVLNFVTYASAKADAAMDGESAVDIVGRVVATHPFRSILIVADESDGAVEISATVRALARDGTDGRKVVHEQVRIDARGPVSAGLPSVVLPLLLPDLPTFLWWPGDPPINHAFWPRMVDACDHLILDSSAFSTPLDSLSLYADFVQISRKHHTFGDLAWKQLAEWRSLVSQFFDNPACADCLEKIVSVTIEYAARPPTGAGHTAQPNPGVALLLAGWLSARLNWDVTSSQSEQGMVRYQLRARDGHRLDLVLKPRISTGPPAAIECVRIDTGAGEQDAHFAVERDRDKPVAHVTASLPDTGGVARSVSLAIGDRATLLAKELDQGMQDRPYEEAVAATGILARRADESRT
jgi:glucose-6-phosphate dehydrogenase assembly protein OpcA